ncbi:hypothetical protein A2U01_0101511, partial [Trifolium medium]|nr:hypothetical protein [Trifolium medium]
PLAEASRCIMWCMRLPPVKICINSMTSMLWF